MLLKFKTLALLSLCFVSLPSLGLAASLDKAILLNEHGLTTDAKRELIDVIFQKGSKTDDKAQAYYLLGNIAFGEDKIKVALNSWEHLVDKYPNSEEAKLVRDRIAELSEIVIGSAKESLDNAVARSYLRHADFWSDDKSDVFSIDSSWISKIEAGIKWYDKVISEFPKSKASRIAYEGKLKTLLGWKEPGKNGNAYGIEKDFDKYIPQLLQTFEVFEREYPDASKLQAFRYQIAQVYWSNALSLQNRAQVSRTLAQSSRESAQRWQSLDITGAQRFRQRAQQQEEESQTEQEKATKSLEVAKKWLKDIIEKASEHDSFYRDLAERRLKNLEPR